MLKLPAALLLMVCASSAMSQNQPSTCFDRTALDQARRNSRGPSLLPASVLNQALTGLNQHGCLATGRSEIAVVDFAIHSGTPRLWVVNVRDGSGQSSPYYVAHGKGSDPANSGTPTLFGNVPNSNMSSLGAFRGLEVYNGKHGYSVRLEGLDASNSNARQRYIVVHSTAHGGNDYVSEAFLRTYGRLGRSHGCFVVLARDLQRVGDVIKDGGFLFAGTES